VTFHETHLRPGPETDALWEAELPRGHGFTLVDEPDRYGLPQGMPHGDGFNRYGVTWAHQYHCLVSTSTRRRLSIFLPCPARCEFPFPFPIPLTSPLPFSGPKNERRR